MSDTYGETITIPGLYVTATKASYQYHFVKYASTADVITNLAATTDAVVGVLLDAPDASGEAATVASQGIVPIVAGTSTITKGAKLTPDSTGRAITGGATSYGRALEASAAVGDHIRMALGAG